MARKPFFTRHDIISTVRRRFFLAFFLLLLYLRKVKSIHVTVMKKIMFILVLAMLSTAGAQAQLIKKREKKETVENEAYTAGKVPVINGKVTFETEIPAKGLTAAQVEEKMNAWIAERYVKPTVISVQRFDSEKPGTTIIKGEEYIVFRSSFFILSRARMYYFLTLTAGDGYCKFHLSRITYWYDDEDEKGGIKMIAENWITDDNAFNKKGKLKKFEGKFRRKTIDLKEHLIDELTKALNK